MFPELKRESICTDWLLKESSRKKVKFYERFQCSRKREDNQASMWTRGTASQKAWSRDKQGLRKRKFILVGCLLDQKGQP